MKNETILKLAKTIVKSYSKTTTAPGMTTEEDGRKIKVTWRELYKELSRLEGMDLVEVKRCKDCEFFHNAPRAKTGNCFPKDYSTSRPFNAIGCHKFEPKSAERRKIDEAVTELLRKERAGNGSGSSHKTPK